MDNVYYTISHNGRHHRKIFYILENDKLTKITIKKLKSMGIDHNKVPELVKDIKKACSHLPGKFIKNLIPPMDIIKKVPDINHEYLTFQRDLVMPFKHINEQHADFKEFLKDGASIIGVVRLMDMMTHFDADYSELERFVMTILNSSSNICRGYRNYYGYTRKDLSLFPQEITKTLEKQNFDLFYIPDIPIARIREVERIKFRRYINLDDLNNINVLKVYNTTGISDAIQCITSKSANFDYLMLSLRFHVEPTEYKMGYVHSSLLIVDMRGKNANDKFMSYFIDLFGTTSNSSNSNSYAISSFADLSGTHGFPLFFSAYTSGNIPEFVLNDNKSLSNVWNWFLIALDILNPDVGRIEILRRLNTMNKVNRTRLIHLFMFSIYNSYGKNIIIKYMLEGIEEHPVSETSPDYMLEIWDGILSE